MEKFKIFPQKKILKFKVLKIYAHWTAKSHMLKIRMAPPYTYVHIYTRKVPK